MFNTTFRTTRHALRFFSNTATVQKKEEVFTFNDNCKGKIAKFELTNKNGSLKEARESVEALFQPSALHIMTMPTQRVQGDMPDYIYPGHNASFITDKISTVLSFMSKRQDKGVLSEKERIPDARFPLGIKKVHVCPARFTSMEEELTVWFERALRVTHYPLYLHILPMQGQLAPYEKTYQQNVDYLLKQQNPYTLFSSIFNGRWLAADNCNTAVEKSILGDETHTVSQDQFCQQAVVDLILQLIQNPEDYLQKVQNMQVCLGSEHTDFTPDVYQPTMLL